MLMTPELPPEAKRGCPSVLKDKAVTAPRVEWLKDTTSSS